MTARVLVVDDSKTIRTYLRMMLEKQEIEVEEACDGLEALEKLAPGHEIHVVVTDLQMPNMGGGQLVRTIRSMERLMALPVIMVTASQEEADQNESLVAGANDYISKPFDNTLLTAKIRNLAALRQIQLKAEEASWTDGLTGLANRRFGDIRLAEEIERARRNGHALAVALVDIDHFKLVNDTHGHQAGDDVLVELAKELRSVSRRSDVVARWGGEEFLFVFPETSLEEAAGIVDRFREHMAKVPVTLHTNSDDEVPVTVSGGVAELEDGDTLESIVERADKGLYEAKESGRNRMMMWKQGDFQRVTAA